MKQTKAQRALERAVNQVDNLVMELTLTALRLGDVQQECTIDMMDVRANLYLVRDSMAELRNTLQGHG